MIGVFKKKAELPEYLSHYGMHRAPFSSAAEDDMYYADPIRKQRLDLLLHLAQNTNELLLVTGDEGIGKTMFLRQFTRNTGEHWKICHIEGHKMMTEEQFLQRVFLGFEIAHASVHRNTMFANLKKRLDALLQQAIPVVLLIDDANQFSTKILGLILEIASIKNVKTGNSVRAILFSEPQIKIILAEPELSEKHRLIIRKIDLPALDETNTGEYLHHRLSQAGMETERFLTKPTINKIFRQSNGVPSEINAAADKLLFETTPIIRRTSNIQAERTGINAKYIVIILLLAVTAGIIVFHEDIRDIIADLSSMPYEKTTTPEIVTPKETVTPLKLPALPEPSAEAPDPMQALKEQLSEKSGNKLDQPEPSSSTEDFSEENKISIENATAENTQIETDIVKNITGSADSVTVSKTEPETESIPIESSTIEENQKFTPSSNRVKDKDWILNQNPDYYTLQLVTGHKRVTIDNFIKQYQLNPARLSYYFSIRNGKHWHNLTYGIYPNRKAATAAIQDLPGDLSTVNPWIRKLSSIQSELTSTP